ncbi:MAG: hypothetical protein RR853_08815 [Aurantimicrobium sp.]|uniref:hypothetical protein n=1 Tax=Aurantimicrobium sp. TaxID=1930784 RepID=UPI002FC9FB95
MTDGAKFFIYTLGVNVVPGHMSFKIHSDPDVVMRADSREEAIELAQKAYPLSEPFYYFVKAVRN